jgi:hypothetical protein
VSVVLALIPVVAMLVGIVMGKRFPLDTEPDGATAMTGAEQPTAS